MNTNLTEKYKFTKFNETDFLNAGKFKSQI